MATETKIGLIVGLGFIICFAMILDNHGREAAVPEAWKSANTKASTSHATPSERHSDRSADLRQPAPRSAREGTFKRTGDVRIARRADADFDTGERGVGGRLLRREPVTSARENHTQAARRAGGEPAGIGVKQRRSSPANAAGHDARRSAETDSNTNRRALEELLRRRQGADQPDSDGVRGTVVESGQSGNQLERKPAPAATPLRDGLRQDRQRIQTYVVASGDTLSRIAKAHYGTSSRKVVRAIFEANRNKMPNPDTLRLGLTLTLPAIDEARVSTARRREPETTSSPPKDRRAQAVTPTPGPFRWYQVKKNDRYVSIARNELGDGRRWREIYELNRDRFPDPQRIRWGVRIKLPLAQVATAGR